MRIYHIVLPDDWAAWDTDLYRAKSLETEGFIHCSFRHQLDGVIDRYYKGANEVIILQIETDALMSRTVNEPSTGNEIYPHVYGPINRDAIVEAERRRLA
ncbi:MAG TPA: DUF952 domain-containing protein [Pyrinomonadaceae bacterium]|jgi:uncharacterized protein (DUF952 family)|nr:DUF952 domain-containing protein [Pyrinomonadaceae bacterium]